MAVPIKRCKNQKPEQEASNMCLPGNSGTIFGSGGKSNRRERVDPEPHGHINQHSAIGQSALQAVSRQEMRIDPIEPPLPGKGKPGCGSHKGRNHTRCADNRYNTVLIEDPVKSRGTNR